MTYMLSISNNYDGDGVSCDQLCTCTDALSSLTANRAPDKVQIKLTTNQSSEICLNKKKDLIMPLIRCDQLGIFRN